MSHDSLRAGLHLVSIAFAFGAAVLAPLPAHAMAPPQAPVPQWIQSISHAIVIDDFWGDGQMRALVAEAGAIKVMRLRDAHRDDILPAAYGTMDDLLNLGYFDPTGTGQYLLLVHTSSRLGLFGPAPHYGELDLEWEMTPPANASSAPTGVVGGPGQDLLLYQTVAGGFDLWLYNGENGNLLWQLSTAMSRIGVSFSEFDVTGDGIADWLLETRTGPGAPIETVLLSVDQGPFVGTPPSGTSARLGLGFASPNPFGSETRIGYSLPKRGEASVRVFDPAGRLVRTLARGLHEPGPHSTSWDGTNDDGRTVPSGVYLYEVESGGQREARQLVRVR